ncbi:ClpP/crotonase [Blyttiomyces helicus]|uniref:ClpP/crotonase n=1 Tax=Blyttiomyces helicus TaxID=388810 RepID=A0A4P9W9Y2_9FUNG|nr:ClpP/crotonase [Blyttiomyces helicus]|eukprot:RKO89224.1 ClpP/crotonase [Blyttiomyces helicus]
MSGTPKHVQVTIEKEGYAILTLAREPVNSMDLAVWEHLLEALLALESNPSVRGVIIRSGVGRNVFTAGNDIDELFALKTSAERFTQFWTISNVFLARLLRSPLITVAAIRGACPAGGTCTALACDFRVATEDASMGLNEVALGISVPEVWIKLLASIAGKRTADRMSQFAEMVGAKEGVVAGIVDYVTPKGDAAVMEKAVEVMKRALLLPDPGRIITKRLIRRELAAEWENEERLKKEAAVAWSLLSHPKTVKSLEKVLARLSGPKKSKL